MLDVITVGSATMDVFSVIGQKVRECKLGDKILVKDIAFQTGGGGINAAAGLSRMGLNVGFLGKVGDDHNGHTVIKELKEEKIKVIPVPFSDYHTSHSYILKSSKEKDRLLFAYKGASDHLLYSDFKKSALHTRWIYMATLLGKSFKTAEKIAVYAGKQEIKLLFNPSTYLAKKGKFYLRTILKNTTILVLNKSEAKLLLKNPSNNIKDIVRSLHKLGPDIVVVTEGPKGINAFDGSTLYYLPAYKVRVVSTTGAGDAMASGFLAGVFLKNDLVHALEMGMANAASVIQYSGTKNKLLTHRQAHTFVQSRKEKVIVKRLD